MKSLSNTVTTVFLASLVLLPTTAQPNWNAEKKTKNEGLATTSTIINKKYCCDVLVEAPTINELMPPIMEIVVDATSDDVLSQLYSYNKLEAGWDGSDSVSPSSTDVESAIDFVNFMPAIFPLPKAMLSRDGEVGLYWDDSFVYIDIQFESDNLLSVFSRNRLSGKERFVDSVDVASINSSWYYDILGTLLSPSGYMLAA